MFLENEILSLQNCMEIAKKYWAAWNFPCCTTNSCSFYSIGRWNHIHYTRIWRDGIYFEMDEKRRITSAHCPHEVKQNTKKWVFIFWTVNHTHIAKGIIVYFSSATYNLRISIECAIAVMLFNGPYYLLSLSFSFSCFPSFFLFFHFKINESFWSNFSAFCLIFYYHWNVITVIIVQLY